MEFLNIIILLGAIQGFIISTLLFFSKSNQQQHRFLAFLILIISLACLNLFLLEIDLPSRSAFWANVSMVLPLMLAMPIGPLIFLYVRSLLHPQIAFQRKEIIHFIPLVLDLLPRIVSALYLIGRSANLIAIEDTSLWIRAIDQFDKYFDIPRWISASVYVLIAWRLAKNTKATNSGDPSMKWARNFIYVFAGFQIIWLFHLVPYLIPGLSDKWIEIVNWYPIYIPLAIMVYWLGMNGFLLQSQAKSETSRAVALPMSVVEETKQILLQCMERDHLYLDPVLSLNSLVKQASISQKVISSVLNQHMGKSFNEFVNEYRIRAVKHRLLDGNHHLTITGIAFECGFNSQATFQRAFKQATGQTPTEYLSKHAKLTEINSQI